MMKRLSRRQPYTAETKPEHEFDDADIGDLNAI
jgi:hypothetical protein